MFRPMRPNPLIPTLTAIGALQINVSFYNSSPQCISSYSLLTLILFVVVSPYFVYQAIRYKKYIGSLGQRLGYLPISFNVDGEESIWIHAVSVGEALTARALAEDLKARYPRLRLFLSTTTMAGQEVARRSLHHVDAVFYFPFDWAFIVRRTLNIVKPRVFIMMETELWPNLLRVCRKRGVKTVVINGRISSRSYPRYRLIRPFFRRVLADVDRFCMQSEESARRLVDLGADPAARDGDRQSEVRFARGPDRRWRTGGRANACSGFSASRPTAPSSSRAARFVGKRPPSCAPSPA